MKRQVIPTSPQYSDSDQKGVRSTGQQPVVGLLVLGVLAGAAAGFAASLFVVSQFDTQSQQIVIETAGSANTISQTISTLSPAVRERILSIVNAEGELQAQAVVATTDGWIITPHQLGEGEKVINSRRQTYAVEQTIQDPFTNVYFLKVNQTGLPVVTWSNEDEVSLGLWGLVMQLSPVTTDRISGQTLMNLRTAAAQEQSLVHLTDLYAIASAVEVVPGTPFVAQNSRLIGVVTQGDQVIPGPVIEQRLSYFIDHQAFQTLPDITTRSLFFEPAEGKAGFLVTQSTLPEIQVDDVITQVNGTELTKQDELWSVLLDQEAGSAVTLGLTRQGEAVEVLLTL